MYELTLLGDPEMPIFTDVPNSLTVSHPENVSEEQSFLVTVIDENDSQQPVADALVCIQKGTEIYQRGYTDASGQISLPVGSGITAGTMQVTVTAQNYYPYEGTCTIISAGPSLACNNDINIQDPSGNNDARANPGESIQLDVQIHNYGAQYASGVSLGLTTTDTDITMANSSSALGDISAGNSKWTTTPFTFSVSQQCAVGHILFFNLAVSDDQSNQWNEKIAIEVFGPHLSSEHYLLADANENGLLEPGESATVTVLIDNQGSGMAADVSSTITTADAYVTLNEGSAQLGDIQPLSSAEHDCGVTIDSDCPSPYFAEIYASFTTDGGHTFSDTLLLAIGQSGFYDDVEEDGMGWTHDGPNDRWHRSTQRSLSGSYSWYCGNPATQKYESAMDDSLISPWIMLGANSSLSFWAWYDVALYSENNYKGDGLYVEVYDGSAWTTLDFIGTGGALPSLMGNDWLPYEYDLSYFQAGDMIKLKLHFISDNSDNDYEGMYVDDIKIQSGQELPSVYLKLRIFLEGCYDTENHVMRTDLQHNGYLTIEAPYAEDLQHAAALPDSITDWILVQLRRTVNGKAIASKSALLSKNGYITDPYREGSVSLNATEGDYYIIIKHRSHLAVMSADPQTLCSSSTTLYDFTSGSDRFYGSGGAKELEAGVWGMYTGDINQDGEVTTADYTTWYNSVRAGDSGYQNADINLDGEVTTSDYTIWYNNARAGASSAMP